MDAEMKVPTMEKVVEKKVYEDNKRDYASKGLAGTALGLGIGGLGLLLCSMEECQLLAVVLCLVVSVPMACLRTSTSTQLLQQPMSLQPCLY